MKKGPATRLLLMTTGVLLRMLQMGEGNLDGISHIFVDEVSFHSILHFSAFSLCYDAHVIFSVG